MPCQSNASTPSVQLRFSALVPALNEIAHDRCKAYSLPFPGAGDVRQGRRGLALTHSNQTRPDRENGFAGRRRFTPTESSGRLWPFITTCTSAFNRTAWRSRGRDFAAVRTVRGRPCNCPERPIHHTSSRAGTFQKAAGALPVAIGDLARLEVKRSADGKLRPVRQIGCEFSEPELRWRKLTFDEDVLHLHAPRLNVLC